MSLSESANGLKSAIALRVYWLGFARENFVASNDRRL